MSPEVKGRLMRWGLAVLVLGMAIGLLSSGVFGDLSVAEVVALIQSAGPWGALCFVLAFAILQPLGLSGHLFVVASALVWPPWIACGLSLLGSIGAGITSFLFAKYLASEWVQKRLPERVRKYEAWILRKGLPALIGYRALTFTFQPALLMLGTLRVRFWPMLLATAIGFIPVVILDVWFGGKVVAIAVDYFGW